MATPLATRWASPRPFGLPLLTGTAVLLGTAAVCALLAFAVSMSDWKIALGAVGGVGLAFSLILIRRRALFALMLLVLSTQVVLHKALGPLQTDYQGGGPSGVYITSIDVPLLLLYAFWLADGTLLRDLRRAMKQSVFLAVLGGILSVLPSLFTAEDLTLWMGEFVRLIVGFMLFVYVGMRVRTRREITWVLVALAAVAVIQFVLVVLQAKTGSALGLGVFGAGGTQEGTLAPRTIGGGLEIPRPSGTILHAVLLGAIMASVAAVALNMALHLKPWRLRLFWLAITGVGIGSVVVAMGRAPALGLLVALPLSVAYALVRRRLAWRVLFAALGVGLVGVIVFWGKLAEIVSNNIGTDHFWLEVEARIQLNDVALEMLNTSPLVGVGLNNSSLLLTRFEPYGVIYPNFPAHNVYLLVASETGIVGLIGLIVMLVAPLVPAVRLARSSDRFMSALGCGIAAVLITVYFQELLVLALRYDTPRMVFWLFAGLGVAGWRLMERERRQAVRHAT